MAEFATLTAPVLVGVGRLSITAGTVKQAPRWMQPLCLEILPPARGTQAPVEAALLNNPRFLVSLPCRRWD
jgi:UDP-N-acetyl-D-mannosaminuronic acid transferase (WecB/TagA/CpsF family)